MASLASVKLPADVVPADVVPAGAISEESTVSVASPVFAGNAVPPEVRPGNDLATTVSHASPETTASFVAPAYAAAAEKSRGNALALGVSPRSTAPAKAETEAPRVRTARLDDSGLPSPQWRQILPRSVPLDQATTKLIDFDSAPFPYEGVLPGSRRPFLNVEQGGQRGHRSSRGRIFWEQQTYGDRRVLVHIPKGFDVDRPAVMVVFFHGHGATLKRDVLARQQVPAQISASGANAVLVAPQFAVDAPDSSAGRFWEPGGFGRFVEEAARQLAHLHGDPGTAQKFATMPIVIVAYSGGYVPAAWSLHAGGLKNRLRGVVLLDALYGELEKFASWIATSRSTFFVSAYTHFTRRQNAELERMLAGRDVAYGTELKPSLSRGGVTFLSTGSEANHRDYVTQAWADHPIKDILARLGEYRLRPSEPVASLEGEYSNNDRRAVAAVR